MLPTDPRFQDLTQDQYDMLYEHYVLDHPEVKKNTTAVDPDYQEEEPEQESYHDPDFDDEWNTDRPLDQDANPVNRIIPEKTSEGEGDTLISPASDDIDPNKEEWVEVPEGV